MAVAGDEWRSMILFGLYTGQRLADVATLPRNNLDLVRNEVRSKPKTDKVLILPIAEPLRQPHHDTLGFGLSASPPPSISLRNGGAAEVERQSQQPICGPACSAGMREKKAHRKLGEGRSAKLPSESLSFHSLRRTATTLLHEAGVPAAVAQAHRSASQAMHELYVSVGREALERQQRPCRIWRDSARFGFGSRISRIAASTP